MMTRSWSKPRSPFSLKLMEGLLNENPRHEGLLLATSSGFTEYAYAFVQQDADEMEDKDLAAAEEMRGRARRLYLRARNYGLRGLEVRHQGFEKALRAEPKQAVRVATVKDVPLLYWTALSWAGAISLSKDNPDLIGDMPVDRGDDGSRAGTGRGVRQRRHSYLPDHLRNEPAGGNG